MSNLPSNAKKIVNKLTKKLHNRKKIPMGGGGEELTHSQEGLQKWSNAPQQAFCSKKAMECCSPQFP